MDFFTTLPKNCPHKVRITEKHYVLFPFVILHVAFVKLAVWKTVHLVQSTNIVAGTFFTGIYPWKVKIWDHWEQKTKDTILLSRKKTFFCMNTYPGKVAGSGAEKGLESLNLIQRPPLVMFTAKRAWSSEVWFLFRF